MRGLARRTPAAVLAVLLIQLAIGPDARAVGESPAGCATSNEPNLERAFGSIAEARARVDGSAASTPRRSPVPASYYRAAEGFVWGFAKGVVIGTASGLVIAAVAATAPVWVTTGIAVVGAGLAVYGIYDIATRWSGMDAYQRGNLVGELTGGIVGGAIGKAVYPTVAGTMRSFADSRATARLQSVAQQINPLGSKENCVVCSISLDHSLAGRPAVALDVRVPRGAALTVLAETYRDPSMNELTVWADRAEFVEKIRLAGARRGIVIAGLVDRNALAKGTFQFSRGHAFNAVVEGTRVFLVDGQSGQAFTELQFIRGETPLQFDMYGFLPTAK